MRYRSIAVFVVALSVVAAFWVADADRAEACRPIYPNCLSPTVLAEPTIPPNAPGVVWYPEYLRWEWELRTEPGEAYRDKNVFGPNNFGLTVVDEDETRQLEIELRKADDGVLVVPEEGFEPATDYRLEVHNRYLLRFEVGGVFREGECGVAEAEFQTAPTDYERPSTLGEVDVGQQRREEVQLAVGAACSTTTDAYTREISVDFADEVEPWRHLMYIRTHLRPQGDDEWKTWAPSRSLAQTTRLVENWQGPDHEDLLFSVCTDDGPYNLADRGLDEGTYEVRFEGLVPGGDPVTTEPAEVELSCEG